MSQTLIVHTLLNGPLEENAYFVHLPSASEGVLIDPGSQAQKLDEAILATGVRPAWVLATHGHFDHIGKVHFFQEKYQAKFAMHKGDKDLLPALPDNYAMYGLGNTQAPSVDEFIEDGQDLMVGELELHVMHTPGHSLGGLCFYHSSSGQLFSGDTLFKLSVGRSDFPGGSHEQLLNSIKQKIFVLPDETLVYPGHGAATQVGEEKRHNPFVNL